MLPRRTHPAATKQPGRAPARLHVLFTLAGAEHAVEVRHVRHSLFASAEPEREVRFLDKVYPVLDLRRLFGLEPLLGGQRMLLLVEEERLTAALLVDTVLNLARIEDANRSPLPPIFTGRERQWFEGLARIGDRLVVLVSVKGLLGCGNPPAPSAVATGG